MTTLEILFRLDREHDLVITGLLTAVIHNQMSVHILAQESRLKL